MISLFSILDYVMRYALNLPPREPRDQDCGQERPEQNNDSQREYLDYPQWRNEREFGNPVG